MPDAEADGEAAPRIVAVTGAAGFLGSRIVELLSEAGRFDVTAMDVIRSERAEGLATLPRVHFHAVDMRDGAALDEILAGCESVIHLAAVRTKASAADPRAAFEVNVSATYDLMAAAVAHSVRRFVFGSTQSVYGSFEDPQAGPFRESDATVRPGLNMYAAGKLAGEAFLAAFAADGGPEYLSLRFGTLYGPRVNVDSNGGILLQALQALDRGEPAAIPWARSSLHMFTYVDDAANAVLRALEVPDADMAVNVVAEPVSAEEMYGTLARLAGSDASQLEWLEQRTRYQRVASERLRAVLGLETLTSLEHGLSALIDWYRAGRE